MSKDGKVVLVVDDREDWQETISMTIQTMGYQVATFSDIKTTLQYIEQNNFDLAIIDQRLDETDESDQSGIDLAQTIKNTHGHIPIFIITGYPSHESIDKTRKPDDTGERLATHYILKDDTVMDRLIEAVQEALK